MSKPLDHGGLNWGTEGTSAALLGILILLVLYQIMHLHRHPLEPVPAPVNRRTGAPEQIDARRIASIPQPAGVPAGLDSTPHPPTGGSQEK